MPTLTTPVRDETSPTGAADAEAQPEAQAQVASTADEPALVEVETKHLVTGTQLNSPIYDKSGVLLLAQGALVTSRFQDLLVLRGTRNVMVSQADARSMSAKRPTLAPAARPVEVDADVIEKLDELVDAGKLFIEDSSPKFKERLARHGTKGFDTVLREKLVARHAETCSLLDSMIKGAAHGENQNGGDIATVVSEYLSHLTFDSDLVQDVMAKSREFASLAQHSLEMAILGMALSIEMGMGEESVRVTGLAGLLHDWGMIYVPKHIRAAKRPLTRAEFLEVAKHPIYTANVLERVTGLPPQVALICYHVHERPDGSGYPRGRQGRSIHPCARVLNVADAYVAMTSPRPYRPPLQPHAAMECLIRQASKRSVDPDVVAALLRIVTLYGIGRHVKLSDGSRAIVRRRNLEKYHLPIVQIIEKADGTRVDPNDESFIIDPEVAGLTILSVYPCTGREELGFSEKLLQFNRP